MALHVGDEDPTGAKTILYVGKLLQEGHAAQQLVKQIAQTTVGISDLELVKTMGLRNSGLFQREGRNLGPPAWVDGARE